MTRGRAARRTRTLAALALGMPATLALAWTTARAPREATAACPFPDAALAEPAELECASGPTCGSDAIEVAAERTPVEALAPAGAPIAARVVLRGALGGTRGLARQLDLRLFAGFVRERHELPLPHHTDLGWTPLDDRAVDPRFGRRPQFIELAGPREDARRRGIAAFASSDGRFERDVTDLVASPGEPPRGFFVSIRHDNFRPTDVWVPFEEDGERVDEARLAEERAIALDFAIELTPVCVIRGTASCLDARCAVRLEAWTLRGRELTGLAASDSVSSAGDVFELCVPVDRRLAVVALAEGFLPRTAIVDTFGPPNVELAPFVLDRGVRIGGTVAGGRHTFGHAPWLYLSRENPVFNRDVHGPSALLWTGYEFEPQVQAVRADEGGAFAFTGLAPGAYELRVGIDRDWWTEMDPVVAVYAPADGLVIEPPLAHVAFEIEQDHRPVFDRPVRLEGVGRAGGSARLATDAYGRAEAWLFGGEPYVVHVARPEGAEWSYGKVVPHDRAYVTERIVMGSARGWR